MSSRSRRLALAIAFLFTLSLAAGAADAQKRTPQKPARADQQKQIKATPPGGNGGGKGGGKGGGNGGNDGGDSSTYEVLASLNTGVFAGSTGLIDEGYSLGQNGGSNPAPDYNLGAQMAAPAVGSGLTPLTIEFSGASCYDFLLQHGDTGNNTLTPTEDGSGNIVGGTWSGHGYVRIWLDEPATLTGDTWGGLTDGQTRAVTARINGFTKTTTFVPHPSGKKPPTEETVTSNLFSLRFDDQWYPDSSEGQTLYDALGDTPDDLEITAIDAGGDGAESWTVGNGPSGATALIHPIDSVDVALCEVTVLGQIDRQ